MQAKRPRTLKRPPPAPKEAPPAKDEVQGSTPPPSRPPPSQPYQPSQAPPAPKSLLETLQPIFNQTPELLIYRAPSHTSFFISSYLLGSIFIGVSVVQVTNLSEDRRAPWWIRMLSNGVGVFWVILGTAFLIAPSKLIKSIHLVGSIQGQRLTQPFVRVQTRASLPFIKRFRPASTYNIETPLKSIILETKVLSSPTEGLTFHNVPLAAAQQFTSQFSPPAPRLTLGDHIRHFFRSIIHLPSIIWRDTRRMFLRDGFAYLEIPGRRGHWKMDLYQCYLLEQGQPLMETVRRVKELDRRLWKRVRSVFS